MKYGCKRAVDRHTTVESIFGETKTQHGLARARFRGIRKVAIQFIMTAIALNVKRMVTALFISFSSLFSLRNSKFTTQDKNAQNSIIFILT